MLDDGFWYGVCEDSFFLPWSGEWRMGPAVSVAVVLTPRVGDVAGKPLTSPVEREKELETSKVDLMEDPASPCPVWFCGAPVAVVRRAS